MRGRKPLPTETKELQGTLQPCRTNPFEPKVQKKISEETAPPEYLSDRAKVHWQFVLENEGASWIKCCDRAMLEQYCEQWAELISAREERRELRKDLVDLRRQIRKLEDEKKSYETGPLRERLEELETQDRFLANLVVKAIQPFKSVAAELGFTPSSRSRVIATGEEPAADNKTASLFGDDEINQCLSVDYSGCKT